MRDGSAAPPFELPVELDDFEGEQRDGDLPGGTVRLNGGVASASFAKTLEVMTAVPLLPSFGEDCPTGGGIIIRSGRERARISHNVDGSMRIDDGIDGLGDQSAVDCNVEALRQCATPEGP